MDEYLYEIKEECKNPITEDEMIYMDATKRIHKNRKIRNAQESEDIYYGE